LVLNCCFDFYRWLKSSLWSFEKR